VVSDFEDYRHQAEYCMAVARKVRSNALKADWLRLAADWLEMVPDPVSPQRPDGAAVQNGIGLDDSPLGH
jgi:hypothetical protein